MKAQSQKRFMYKLSIEKLSSLAWGSGTKWISQHLFYEPHKGFCVWIAVAGENPITKPLSRAEEFFPHICNASKTNWIM